MDASDGFALGLKAVGAEAVVETIRTTYPALRIAIGRSAGDSPMLLQHDIAGDERLSTGRMQVSGPIDSSGNHGGTRMVITPRSGRLDAGSGRDRFDTTRPFLYSERDFYCNTDAYVVDHVTVRTTDLQRVAQTITGDPPLHLEFTGAAPVSTVAEQYWRATHRHVAAVLADPAMRAMPILRNEMFRTIARAMLVTFPNTVMDADMADGPASSTVAFDRAVSFMEANSDRPIDLHDIADEAGVPAHALARAFRARGEATVLQVLRSIRLERARQEFLTAGAWSTLTVGTVAARWGFPHPGRFSIEYRRRFGEPPSSTLRR